MTRNTFSAISKSYLRACAASVLAVIATGNYGTDAVMKALLAAALPPLIRWLDPHDKEFGRGPAQK